MHPNEFSCRYSVSEINRINYFFLSRLKWRGLVAESAGCFLSIHYLAYCHYMVISSFFLSFDFFLYCCVPATSSALFKHSLLFFLRCSSSLSQIVEWYHTVQVHYKFNCSQDLYRLDVLHISGISTITEALQENIRLCFLRRRKNVAFLAKCSNPFSEVFVVLWATVAFTVKASTLERGLLSYCFLY